MAKQKKTAEEQQFPDSDSVPNKKPASVRKYTPRKASKQIEEPGLPFLTDSAPVQAETVSEPDTARNSTASAWQDSTTDIIETAPGPKYGEGVATDVPEQSDREVPHDNSPISGVDVEFPSESHSARVQLPEVLYLPLHTNNLSRYLIRDVFYPLALETNEQYVINRREQPDLLNEYPGYLVLTSNSDHELEESIVLVELRLRSDEAVNFEQAGEWFFCAAPIPASRITKLLFGAETTRQRYLASAFDDYIFPSTLSTVLPESRSHTFGPQQPPRYLAKADQTKWLPILDKYDRTLGLFGYLKIADLLPSAPFTSAVQDFPDSLLLALSLLNNAIKPAVEADRASKTWFSILLGLPLEEQEAGRAEQSGRRRLLRAAVRAIYDGQPLTYSWTLDQLLQLGKAAQQGQEKDSLRQAYTIFEKLTQPGTGNYISALSELATSEQAGKSAPLVFTALVLLGKFSRRERGEVDKQAAINHFAEPKPTVGLPDRATLAQLLAIMGLYYGYLRQPAFANLPQSETALIPNTGQFNRHHFNSARFLDRVIIETAFRFSNSGKPFTDNLDYLRLAADAEYQLPETDNANFKRNDRQRILDSPVARFEELPYEKVVEKPFPKGGAEALIIPSEVVEKPSSTGGIEPLAIPSELDQAFPTGQVPATSFLYQALVKLLPQQFSISTDRIHELMKQLPVEQQEILLSALPLDTLGSIPELRKSPNDSTRGR